MPSHPSHPDDDDDDDDLQVIEAHLTAQDPGLAGRFDAFAMFGTWPVPALTTAWIVWTALLLITGLATSNPAALVLGLTWAWAYPVGMTVALQFRLTRHRHARQRQTHGSS